MTRIHTETLENGLTVALEEMPWLPSAGFELLIPAGAVTDPEGQEGSMTVLHDWLYRGAGGLDSRSFSDALDGLGVRRGGGAGKEYSTFSASLLAETLPEALGLYADMLLRPHLSEGEFDSARTVALQELASLDDNPTQRLFIALAERYFASAHGRSGYGTEEGLEQLTPQGVKADYERRIKPNGAILAVAGGVEWERLLDTVKASFGAWQGEGVPIPEVQVNTSHRGHLTADTSQVQIGVAFEGVAPGTDGWYPYALANNVLSGGMGSRLFMEVREKRGLVYSVAAVNRAVRGFGYTLAYAGTTPQRADETLEVLLNELKRMREGVGEEELERARTGMLSALVMQGESSGARAAALSKDIFLLGEPRTVETVKAGVQGVTTDALNEFLGARLEPDFTILTLGPAAQTPTAEVVS